MLLTDVKGYLAERGRASLTDLSARFAVDPEAMRGIVDTWVAKGRARLVSDSLPCGTCGKCKSATSEIYEWLGTAVPPRRPCGEA